MTEQLGAPWRLVYNTRADVADGCVFGAAAAGDDEELLVVHRGERAFALLNKYPYASGHLMVAPLRHVGEYGALDADEAAEIHRLTVAGIEALRSVYAPQGFNVGWNLGRAAGGSVADHLHEHVVPRWAGDTNFMPVLGDVKVMPEHLRETRRRLAAAWPG
jgi:ATP adenylyltransferase